jgi:hypothetical protein
LLNFANIDAPFQNNNIPIFPGLSFFVRFQSEGPKLAAMDGTREPV